MGDLSKLDLAWAAGITDGEGYIGAHKDQNHTRLKLQVGNTDPEMILKLYGMFGGHLYVFPKKKNKQQYCWTVKDSNAVDVIAQIFPYLVTKKDEARLALEFSGTYKGRFVRLPDSVHKKRERLADKLKKLKKSEGNIDLWMKEVGNDHPHLNPLLKREETPDI